MYMYEKIHISFRICIYKKQMSTEGKRGGGFRLAGHVVEKFR